MLSVIVYTKNNEDTIGSCLESLRTQQGESPFELVVIDDCSSDRTIEILKTRFPQVPIIQNEQPLGWIVSLSRYLTSLSGKTIAFLGSHCRARSDWILSIYDEMGKDCEVISGMGYHGRGRFLDRFEALSIHPEYVRESAGEVSFLWDDNFAISLSRLIEVFPKADMNLSGGAGAFLLSRKLKERGIKLYYRPSVKVDHISQSLLDNFRFWHKEMAKNAVTLRLLDRSLPGAGMLHLDNAVVEIIAPAIAAFVAMGRWVHGVMNMIRAKKSLSVSNWELCFHIGLLTCCISVYYAGLWNQIIIQRKQVCNE